MIFARKKVNKIPEFLPENIPILHNNCPKNIFPDFGAARAPLPSPVWPVSYAYEFDESRT